MAFRKVINSVIETSSTGENWKKLNLGSTEAQQKRRV